MVRPVSDRVKFGAGCAVPPTVAAQPAATITTASSAARHQRLLMLSIRFLPYLLLCQQFTFGVM